MALKTIFSLMIVSTFFAAQQESHPAWQTDASEFNLLSGIMGNVVFRSFATVKDQQIKYFFFYCFAIGAFLKFFWLQHIL